MKISGYFPTNIFASITFCLLLAAFGCSSCSQEILTYHDDSSKENTSYVGNGEYVIDLRVEDAFKRTRAVDFSETGSIRLNQVWLGVFDYDTGKLVSSQTKTMEYRTVLTGTVNKALIRVAIDDSQTKPDGNYVMVCLANYLDVNDNNGNSLEDRLNDVETWDDFNSIAVDVNTAYSNMHNGIVPVLAGFLYDNTQGDDDDNTHIKIDQFKQDDNENRSGILLSPSYKINKVIIHTDSEGKFNFTDMLLKLRRLVANVNVNINVTNPNLLLTDVTYKRYNMPKAVYIIERRLTNCTNINEKGEYTPGEFAPSDNPDQSPNWADLDPVNSYYNDTEWQYGNTTSFQFQHFANKHWARNDVEIPKDNNGEEITLTEEELFKLQQSFREKCVKYGVDAQGNNLYYYKALVDEKNQNDFNNYASYFVIKMHLIDNTTGKALEAEYTIHEGNTSDELGNPVDKYYNSDNQLDISNLKGRYKDYGVARNIDYTYNVFIEGVENIYHNVNIGNIEGEEHHNGQGGKVWQFYYFNDTLDVDGKPTLDDNRMDYLEDNGISVPMNCHYIDENGTFVNPVPPSGGYFKNAIKITSTKPDLSFRLYGYTLEYDRIDGYNYNFPQESFSYLNKLWPPSAGLTSHYFLSYGQLTDPSNNGAIPNELLEGFKVIDRNNSAKGEMNLIEFVKYIKEAETETPQPVERYFDVRIYETNINDNPDKPKPDEGDDEEKKEESAVNKKGIIDSRYKNNYVRAIYITDRNGVPDEFDGCTRVVNVFAGCQYPYLEEVEVKAVLEVPFLNLDLNFNYNIIEPTVTGIKIPVLKNVIESQSDYKYQVLVKGTGVTLENALDISSSGKLDATRDNYEYTIPMYQCLWDKAEIFVRAVSLNEEKYESSPLVSVGWINLLNPPQWIDKGNNATDDWSQALNFYATPSKNKFDGQYLHFFVDDKNGSNGSEGDISIRTDGIRMFSLQGGSRNISVNVYKPCKITVRARNIGIKSDLDKNKTTTRHLFVKLNTYDNTITEGQLSTTPDKNKNDANIGEWTDVVTIVDEKTPGWKKGEANKLILHPMWGGIDIYSIKIEEL